MCVKSEANFFVTLRQIRTPICAQIYLSAVTVLESHLQSFSIFELEKCILFHRRGRERGVVANLGASFSVIRRSPLVSFEDSSSVYMYWHPTEAQERPSPNAMLGP